MILLLLGFKMHFVHLWYNIFVTVLLMCSIDGVEFIFLPAHLFKDIELRLLYQYLEILSHYAAI